MRCRFCNQLNAPGRLYCAECGTSLRHFVGRERELELLRGALSDALSGRGRLALVAGEPGIGKTRTAEELAAYAVRVGARVLWGRCREAEGGPPFWPWMQILRASLDAEPGEIIPELAALSPAAVIEPEHSRFRLFDAVATRLRNAAAGQPIVVILDDLDLADKPSLILLQFVAGEVGDAPLLVLGTYRHTELTRHHPLSDTLGELARNRFTERVMLRGLAEGDVSRLIAEIAGEHPSEAVAAAVTSHTEGNPLFIVELVPLLVAEGRLRAAETSSLALAVPQGVREVIGRRLNGLSPESNEALTLAAVIGREFEASLLERVGDLPPASVSRALEEALSAHVIVEVPKSAGRYAFAHNLVRETLYQEISPIRRTRLHRQTGEALEALPGWGSKANLPQLAHHFFASVHAGQAEKAIRYATLAGAGAMGELAYEEAAGHYRRALQALDSLDRADATARCDLLLALGEAETGSGNRDRAREAFCRAAEIARASKMPERLARAALGVGAGFRGFWGPTVGPADEPLIGLLEESLAALGPGESALRAQLLARLAVAFLWSPAERRRSPDLCAEAMAIARRLGDPMVELAALAGSHWADWRPDNVAERLAAATEILRSGEMLGHPELLLLGHTLHLADALEAGNIREADQDVERFARLAEDLKQPYYRWLSAAFRAMRALLAGRFEEGERLAGEALELGQRSSQADPAGVFGVHLFTIRRERGGVEESRGDRGAERETCAGPDDLHAADASSLLLLHFLARERRDARILLVGAFRGFESGSSPTLATTPAALHFAASTRARSSG